jgi:hypothetical protein
MQEFQAFLAAADNGGVNTVNFMLDAPFNHTSFNRELGAKGATFFLGANPQPRGAILFAERRLCPARLQGPVGLRRSFAKRE